MEANIDPVVPPADGGAGAKKRPGRPKKKAVVPPVAFKGVVPLPQAAANIFELVYNNPIIFKKQFQIPKGYDVEDIEISISATELIFRGKDHTGVCNIEIFINGHNMNSFYLRHPVKFYVKREDLGDIFGSLTKDHTKIVFILNESDYRSKFYITTSDSVYSKKMSYDLNIITKNEENALVENSDVDYPIKFTLSSKDLKGMIANIKKISPMVTFSKAGTGHLQISFKKNQSAIDAVAIYDDPAKIKMISTLDPDDNINVSVAIDYIKSFSNANIGDDIVIAIDKFKKMSFTAYIDRISDVGDDLYKLYACMIKVFVEIRSDERKQMGEGAV